MTEPSCTDNFFRQENCADYMVLWNTNHKVRNALSVSYTEGLMSGLEQAADDEKIRAVILAAEGSFFCSGGDLRTLIDRRAMTVDERRDKIDHLQNLVRCIRRCPKPVIAAVEGGAAGAGLSLMLACDIIVSAEKAKFVLAYVRAGLIPDGGVTQALMQCLPRATASRMALMAQPISAERLHQLGVISDMAKQGEALQTARGLAEELACGPPKAIGSIKALLNSASDLSMDDQFDAERDAMADAMGGAEAKQGISAFLNKRKPDFRGN